MPTEKPDQSISEEEVEQWYDEEEDEVEAEAGQADSSPSALEEKYSATQIQIVRSTIDFTLHTLQQSLKDPSYINISPEYQRRTRWDRKRRSLLIESFLMNIPVPPIFLFENQYNQYEAMDGRQRLETIREFLDNGFALGGLEYFKELNGKRFRSLTPTIQRGLLRRSITAIVLLAETTRASASVHDVRMILFRRLNTGGARLNPQEMRNALYPGEFKDMIARVARDEKFCEIWRIPKKTPDEDEQKPPSLTKNALYRNMADCELVLRFFAIKETIASDLKGSIRHILDKCMDRHSNDKSGAVAKAEGHFLHCLHTLYKIFDGKAFVLPTTNRPSRPLYDALMVALSRQSTFDPMARSNPIREALRAALDDRANYDILIGRGNTVDAIKDRVALAEQILVG
jgi:uncharacterized protein DUF262